MFLTSVKEIIRLTSKEISSSLKILDLSKLWFSKFEKFIPRSVFEAPSHAYIIEFENFLLNLKIKGLRVKTTTGYLLFQFWNELWNPSFLLCKNVKVNKNKIESKLEKPTHVFTYPNLKLRRFGNTLEKFWANIFFF